MSRADRHTKSQLEEVAKQIKETLENNGIEFLGIGTYSLQGIKNIKSSVKKAKFLIRLRNF
ncbi:hypothetical protein HpNP14_11220 [Helicobacter pylori]